MITSIIAAAQAAQSGSGSFSGMLIMLVVIFAIMWFFMIRPQQKRQKKIRQFQNSLEPGARVVTGGGIYGTVKRIDQEKNIIELEIARGVVIEVDKGYVFQDVAQQQPNA